MRKEFELTDEELGRLLDADKPVPYLIFGGLPPSSPQEKANSAWQSLAEKHGFQWDTVQPIAGKDDKFFTAETTGGE